ncbi:Prephenate dehydratase (PDT) [Scheffersomyces stipitis CBS 6054]|uniref:prephenate dehydratase n=1 Tax=Scheffersomyces stipitis (strain ATCC 58785 / CBS 6054 / NBRC 10063 / NRRL Y-11545) TaxID=322104 RepID=A3LZW3_PICST|nr:Prephenate dehydratase (PDT) [Scheffersomyces stipitis CBS 6054]ABN68609.2 Prephenate dehydratase (PDT) [Scheffersomyces stipitis CBS 6054]
MVTKVAFLGPEGTYTHQAVIQQFGNKDNVSIYPVKTISDCFKEIHSKNVDFAVVPLENSINGGVVFTFDLIRDWFIPSLQNNSRQNDDTEQFVSIHHNFLTRAEDVSKITCIYSHPQVWTQVTGFLSTIPASIPRIDSTSTSKAAELVNGDESNTSACISSQMSSDLYQLPIRNANIEDNPNNTTRFLVLGYEKPPAPSPSPAPEVGEPERPDSRITSIIFTLNHNDPGALCDVLYEFKKNGVNLTSITSRPSHLKQWQYVFFAEVIGDSSSDANIAKGIESASSICSELVVLGSFDRSWRYWKSS